MICSSLLVGTDGIQSSEDKNLNDLFNDERNISPEIVNMRF